MGKRRQAVETPGSVWLRHKLASIGARSFAVRLVAVTNVGVTRAALSLWAKGYRPSPKYTAAIAKAFRIPAYRWLTPQERIDRVRTARKDLVQLLKESR